MDLLDLPRSRLDDALVETLAAVNGALAKLSVRTASLA
jgi:hypothetical protein